MNKCIGAGAKLLRGDALVELPSLNSAEAREKVLYFRKWLVVVVLIGLVSGFGALIFNLMVEHAMAFFLTNLAGYKPPLPGEFYGEFTYPAEGALIMLSLTVGGLISGLVVSKVAPEAEGHGTDAAVEAFHHKEGKVRARVPLVKMVASAVTIGSGGSGGKEGPVAQIGAGFGSLISSLFKMKPKERRMAAAIGLGSGISAMFKTPFGGAIFASEVLYMMDFEPEVIPLAFIASFIGYLVVGYFTGWGTYSRRRYQQRQLTSSTTRSP